MYGYRGTFDKIIYSGDELNIGSEVALIDSTIVIDDCSDFVVWARGTSESTATSGSIDLEFSGNSGNMPFYVNIGTATVTFVADDGIIYASTEVADTVYTSMKINKITNNLDVDLDSLEVHLVGKRY